MDVDYDVAMENASHEAVVRQAYRNPGDVWTWSVGLTSATGHRVERYIGKPQSMQHCMNIYVWALRNYAEEVKKVFADHPLTKPQFAAAVSFTWNLGIGALRKASWVRHFKAGKMRDAEAAWKRWNKAAGKVNSGLVRRRQQECDLFFRGKWSNNGTITEYTRVTPAVDFRSGRRVNVEKELRRAFIHEPAVQVDKLPNPEASVNTPTVTPEISTPKEKPMISWRPIVIFLVIVGLAVAAYFLL